jgi:[acyl-carrier-protein] S-malonyltransferase
MKSKIAFLFPGQGTVPNHLPPVGKRSEELLGLAAQAGILVGNWLQEGDSNCLSQTEFAQPAIFIDSTSKDEALRSRGIIPSVVAGHSLGEYAALVSAGVLTPEFALQVVIRRGHLMGQVCGGGMAAILKLSCEEVQAVCAHIGDGVNMANINGPTQIVISGDEGALEHAMAACEELGGRAIRLNVSGPFHSPRLAPSQANLTPLIEEVVFHSPTTAYVSSVSGLLEDDPPAIKALLLTQITACVQWVDTIESLLRMNIRRAIEVGPGKVLTNLGRRITDKIEFITFEEATDGTI